MDISRDTVGALPGPDGRDGPEVESYTLDNGAGLSITVWTYGATLVEVRVPDANGVRGNVVVRLPTLADYLDRSRDQYIGCVMGRFCRCVAHGAFELDGVRHLLDRNDGPHHIHGGPSGFDTRLWTARARREPDALALELSLHSPNGDQGYPGAVDARCTYRIDGAGRLRVDFTATADAPTLIGLTSHTFWNLAGDGTIDDHLLRLDSDRIVAFDDLLIPLAGPPVSVAGTALDFTAPRRIGDLRLDNFFPLASGERPLPAVELTDPASGRRLRISTDHPGVGVYSGDHLSRARAGLCLQPSAFPDAPNRPDFPSARLDPGRTYHRTTWHAFDTLA
jgi:aldose 1-epimerase